MAEIPALGSRELLRRVAGSVLIMFAARLGTFIPVPDIDLTALPEMRLRRALPAIPPACSTSCNQACK